MDSGGPYGALSTSFGQLQTEHPQSGISLNWSFLDKRIIFVLTLIHNDLLELDFPIKMKECGHDLDIA